MNKPAGKENVKGYYWEHEFTIIFQDGGYATGHLNHARPLTCRGVLRMLRKENKEIEQITLMERDMRKA